VDNTRIREAIAALVGKAPWDVRLGVGSFLTLEFGKHVVQAGERRQHGEWHLWLYMCNWRLESPSGVLVGSSDERETIEKALNTMHWGSVSEAIVDEPALDLRLSFASGHRLKTFSSESTGEDQWILYTPDGMAISVNGRGHSR